MMMNRRLWIPTTIVALSLMIPYADAADHPFAGKWSSDAAVALQKWREIRDVAKRGVPQGCPDPLRNPPIPRMTLPQTRPPSTSIDGWGNALCEPFNGRGGRPGATITSPQVPPLELPDGPRISAEFKVDPKKNVLTGNVVVFLDENKDEKYKIEEGKVDGKKIHFVTRRKAGNVQMITRWTAEMTGDNTIRATRLLSSGKPEESFTLRRQAPAPVAQSFKVSGIVTGIPGGQNNVQRRVTATLTPVDPTGPQFDTVAGPNGSFSFKSVRQGAYVLHFKSCPVMASDCMGAPQGGNTAVTVSNQDVVNLRIDFNTRSVTIPAQCPPGVVNRTPALCGAQIGGPALIPAPAVISPSLIAPSGRPVLLETRLGMIPHAPPATVKDCGHVPRDAVQPVISCVEGSLRAKSPFIASFEQKGIDSVVIIGLGGTGPDGVIQVLFDGNSGGGPARVSAPRDCPAPKFTVAGASVQVMCN
jgi:hypothetical protein